MPQPEYVQRGYLREDFRLFHLKGPMEEQLDWHYHTFHKPIFFLCGTSTMLLTTKIKEFSYYERFDAIFVLSLLVFVTNVAAKLILDKLAECSRTDQKAGSTRS